MKHAHERPIRVGLVDDQAVLVEGLAMVLSAEGDIEVVGLAAEIGETVARLGPMQPDVVVLAGHGPVSEAAVEAAVASVRRGRLAWRLLVLRDGDGADARRTAHLLELGADAVLGRHVSGRQLVAAIHALARGRAPVVTPAATAEVVAAATPARAPDRQQWHLDLLLRTLSRRERQVLALLVSGYSNRRIAEECLLSLNTVRAHVQSLLVKFGVHSKLEAAAFAVGQGIVALPAESGRANL